MNRAPSLAFVAGMVIVAAGLIAGLGRLDDNSFLTHLATGRLIVDNQSIPHHDGYTFTATGHAWVVQSWLASLIYGLGDKVAGAGGVQTIIALAAATLGWLVWALTKPASSLIPRLVVAGAAFGVGLDFWIERPLLFGLVALCLCLLAAEDRLDPRWLVPAMWLWVNTHGSFPLGLVAIAALGVGRRLDREDPAVEVRALKWAAIGVAAGAINPLGPKLLVFPLELLSRQSVLQNVIEWQAPAFKLLSQRIFLLEVVIAILVLVRRPAWRAAVPLVLFTAAALLGSRNVVVASIVMLPGLARGLADLGTVSGAERRSIFRIAVVAIAALMVIALASRASEDYPPNGYPVKPVAFLQENDLTERGTRLLTQDFVGNYLEFRFGPRELVFVDDRFDMFPEKVVDDYLVLLRGQPEWKAVLARYEPDAILWQKRLPLAQLVEESSDWEIVYEDREWVIATPG